MIGERLGRMEANNVGQQQPIYRNQFPIGLRPQQAEGALVQPHNIRIAFPIFSGDNPSGWVFRCEQYQCVTALTEAELLSLATTRFGSLKEANAGGTLSKLRQTGTIKEYQLQFERKNSYQEELISVANQKMNYHPTFTRSSSTLPGPSQLALTSRAHTSSTPSLLGAVPPGLPPYRRLSATEQAERHTKGLCFNYDEQFKPGHRCKIPQLLLLEADVAKDAELENEFEDASPIVEISLKALTGLSPQNTMRDGGVINSFGKCYDVPVSIQGFQFQLDFYLLPVSGCDIVLGAEWLQSLGAIL
ncbi:hypothetical protein JRO89_XS14G0084500 [Xanthoceras sorbifolium]|uniref:Retrotransposon gag domain-containing protein n=1 Tax=Xanthoceras sorbifolium TaxID=99658 RepID=A0ABQ8H4I2_9ROSI|nr:hypothetical protein JRO89_XS14G0084500 [Xanthoceras sorbifolium]